MLAGLLFLFFLFFAYKYIDDYTITTHNIDLSVSIFFAIIYYLLWEGFNRSITGTAVGGSVEKLFRNLIAIGIITLAFMGMVYIIPSILQIDKQSTNLFYIINICASLLYIIYSFSLYKKLVFLRKTKRLQRAWRVLSLMLIIGLISMPLGHFFHEDYSIIFNYTILFIAAILVIIIIPNNKWIAFIDRKTKITCLLYLLILLLISCIMFFSNNLINLNFDLKYRIIINDFMLIIFGFFVAYNLFSILTLVFNWPLFSTMDSQLQAIKDFQLINQNIIRNQDLTQVYNWLFNVSINATQADAAYLHLYDRKDIAKIEKNSFVLSKADCIDLKNSTNWKQYADKVTYIPALKKTEIHIQPYESALLISLKYEKRNLANIILFKEIEGGFDRYMINLVKSYTDQAQLIIESTDLFKKNIQSERYKAELNTARKVQRALFPNNYPNSPYFELSGYSESASEIGGDYFDYLVLDDTRLAVIMADVSGSGASAALYMAELKGMFQGLIRLNLPVDMFLSFCNEALSNCMDRASFITLTFCLFDYEQNKMSYCRAGHTPLLHYSAEDESAHFLVDEGMGLAMIRNQKYNQFIKVYRRTLNPGDIYVLYTDGLSEEKSAKGEEYGEERLRFGLDNYAKLSSEEIVASLIEDHVIFTDEKGEKDDRSLLVVKIK